MTPIFSSHYSIGKSILTLEHPDKNPEGARSVFSIAKENNLKKIVLVENCLTGFPQALKMSEEMGIQLCFGLQINVCEQGHKVIVFALNSKGCQKLNQIYSEAFSKNKECASLGEIKKHWSEDLSLAIPFYDSFIYKNTMTFDNCTPDFKKIKPTFFIESNGLPFDQLIKNKVEKYCKLHNLQSEEVKSIYYENKDDAESLQAYKCITSRRFGKSSLTKPNLDHFGSNEFCAESYLQS